MIAVVNFLISLVLFLSAIASLCLIGIDIIHNKLNSSIISFFKKSIWDIDCWFSGLNILVLWLFSLFSFSVSTLLRAGFTSILQGSIISPLHNYILSRAGLKPLFFIIAAVIVLLMVFILNYIFQFITYLLLLIIMLLYKTKTWLNSINQETKKTLKKYGYYLAFINLFIAFTIQIY